MEVQATVVISKAKVTYFSSRYQLSILIEDNIRVISLRKKHDLVKLYKCIKYVYGVPNTV